MSALKRNWPHDLAEAAGLAFFMICASAYTTILRWPYSPLQQWISDSFSQLVALGVPMGFVIAAIMYSPWGKKSGAHINPSVTIAFWRLGKITRRQADARHLGCGGRAGKLGLPAQCAHHRHLPHGRKWRRGGRR